MLRHHHTLIGICALLLALFPPSAFAAERPDTTFWHTIENTDLPDLFEMFIARYPNSAHRQKAEQKLRLLKGHDQPSALDQAKTLIKTAPRTRSISAKPARTRAPALAAPALAAAPTKAAAPLPQQTGPATKPAHEPAETASQNKAEKPDTTAQDDVANEDEYEHEDTEPVDKVIENERIILLQHHLNRVGCRTGSLDGVWGENSQQAAARFARAINKPLVTIAPTARLLRFVKSYEGGVCTSAAPNHPASLTKRSRAKNRPALRKRLIRQNRAKPRHLYKSQRTLKKRRKVKRKIRRKKANPVHKIVRAPKYKKIKKRSLVKKAYKRKKKKTVHQARLSQKSQKVRKIKKVRKVKVVKRKKPPKVRKTAKRVKKVRHSSGKVSGDPFTDAVKAVGASSGGGGWN